MPPYVREVVEEVAFQARNDRRVDKRSGVSQRLPISVLETVVSNAERRAFGADEGLVVPRVTDLYAALPSITGKIELEYEGELKGADAVARELIRGAVAQVFDGYFVDADVSATVAWFDNGGSVMLGDGLPASACRRGLQGAGAGGPGRTRRAAQARRRRWWPPPWTSCSKDSTRRSESAAPTPAATSAPSRCGGRRRCARPRPSRSTTTRSRCRGRRSGTTTDARDGIRPGSRTRDCQRLARPWQAPAGPGRCPAPYMKFKYGKYIPSLADEVDMEELVSALSEMLLSSGFQSPFGDGSLDGDRTMQALHDAILDALLNGGLLPDDLLEQLFGEDAATAKQQLDELVQQLMERMQEAGYITPSPELEQERERRAQPGGGDGDGEAGRAKFEVTDKALDFLGFRALRDLLGSIGHASAGRHDTRDMATGIDASGAPKHYEFGDTLNLDASSTVLNAVTRAHRDAGSGQSTRRASTSPTRT